ncbi:type III pantothenate kinase [Hydrogenoanaerobacterium sp.]|uniref:type III pantothenate kinase n=1 Tax=Hydrogenoanaerobacterium sp. TaxID=2953763 RepID=UPI002898479F|nr:type III pantothenate kinase [Hydrogenoanaerobacterium sp.]
MILAIDIGNSNIVIGGYEGSKLLFVSRISTDASRTEFEYAVVIKDILELYSYDKDKIEGAIVSSVVPPLSSVLKNAVRLVKPVHILTVGPGIKTGLNIKIDNPGQLGADLLSTAIGAMEKYPLPAIIIDLGTATKFTVVDKEKGFRGGAIMPGVMIALEALSSKTAQLPQISLEDEVRHPIGTNTIDCMKSGVILGAASMIDGMVDRYKAALGEDATVIACGGLVNAIVPYCTSEIIRDDHLLLDGLLALYKKNTN